MAAVELELRREETRTKWTISSRLGFWSAVLVTLSSAVAFGIGIVTPAQSGPYCTGSCIGFPYTAVAAFVPRDYLWMYPAMIVPLMLIVLLVAVHHCAAQNRKPFSLIALCFAAISGSLLIVDYFIQLAVVQPSLLLGETADLSLFSMYNPHGIFIALEDIGYLMMSVAFLFAAAAFMVHGRLGGAIRWLLTIAGIAGVVSFAGLCLTYGVELDYRFEVTVLSINWTTLIIGGILLAFHFRRMERFGLS